MESKNDRQLASFMNYCYRHPEQRFWQALRNWAEVQAVLAQPRFAGRIIDTFYLEDNRRLQVEDPS